PPAGGGFVEGPVDGGGPPALCGVEAELAHLGEDSGVEVVVGAVEGAGHGDRSGSSRQVMGSRCTGVAGWLRRSTPTAVCSGSSGPPRHQVASGRVVKGSSWPESPTRRWVVAMPPAA